MIKVTNRRNKRRMKVKITTTANWYKKGQIHEVGQYMVNDFSCKPAYEKAPHFYGIDITHCKIINQ